MTFDDAMAAHIVWKVRLRRMIEGGNSEGLESALVGKDDLCEFGKWVYDYATKHNTSKLCQEVVSLHARFHVCAADVVKCVEDGDSAGARDVMGGPFEEASRRLVDAVAQLRAEAAEDQEL